MFALFSLAEALDAALDCFRMRRIISSRSRYVSEYRRYQRTHKRMITSSKCRPRKSAGLFRVTIHRTKSPQPRLQQSPKYNRGMRRPVSLRGGMAPGEFSATGVDERLDGSTNGSLTPRHRLHEQLISFSSTCVVPSFKPCSPAARAGYTYHHMGPRMKRIDDRVNGLLRSSETALFG